MAMFDVVAVDDFFVSSKFAIILDADENELPQIKNYELSFWQRIFIFFEIPSSR